MAYSSTNYWSLFRNNINMFVMVRYEEVGKNAAIFFHVCFFIKAWMVLPWLTTLIRCFWDTFLNPDFLPYVSPKMLFSQSRIHDIPICQLSLISAPV